MMLKHFFAVLILIILTGVAYGQPKNQRDAAGLRQGFWEAVDNRGMPVFSGYFKDDKPIGEMTRYFPTGGVRSIMNHDDTGVNARARLFWPNGEIAAQGIYVNTQRDSVWLFYNQIGTLMSRIEYKEGKQNGIEQKFYPNGIIFEEVNWKDSIKHGEWKQYFNNGQLKIAVNYINGSLEGQYTSFYLDGNKEIEGVYKDGVPHGDWIRYKENGEYAVTIKYNNGTIMNPDVLEEAERIFFEKAIDPELGLPERTIEDLFR